MGCGVKCSCQAGKDCGMYGGIKVQGTVNGVDDINCVWLVRRAFGLVFKSLV